MRTNAKIYVMRDGNGLLKLGMSADPHRRAREIGKGISVVHETDSFDRAEEIERLAHKVLALHGKHIRGEWFEAELDGAIEAIAIAVRQAEELELPLGGRLRRSTSRRDVAIRGQISVRDENGEMEALIDDLRRWAGYPTPSKADVIRDALREKHARQSKSNPRS